MDWDTLPSGDINHSNEIGIEKMPAPTAGIFDTPLSCGVRINSEWLSFIIARLEILADPRAWLGDEATANTAAQQIELLLEALSESQECLYPQPEILNPLTNTTVQINIPDDPVYADVFFEKMAELANPSNWEGSEETTQLIGDVWAEVLDTAQQNFGSGEPVMPASFRVNNGIIEYQPYGGAGWEILGDACPCPADTYSPEYALDDPDPDNRRCAIATGLVEWLWAKGGDVATAISVASDLAGAIDGVLVLFLPVYLAVDQVTDYIREIVEAEVGQFQLYMSVDNKEAHQQWIYCRMLQDDLTEMSSELWSAYKQWVYDEATGGADVGGILFHSYLQGYTTEAINDRARIASYGGGNCVGFECAGWEHTWEFLTESHSAMWSVFYASANWIAGEGWIGQTDSEGGGTYQKYVAMESQAFAEGDITEIEMEWEYHWEAGGDGRNVRYFNGAWNSIGFAAENNPIVAIGALATKLRVVWGVNAYNLSNANNSIIKLKKVIVRGIGANPFA